MRITVPIASVALKRFSSFIFNAETVFFLQRVPATTAEEKKKEKETSFLISTTASFLWCSWRLETWLLMVFCGMTSEEECELTVLQFAPCSLGYL